MTRALLLDDERIERTILQFILFDAGFDVQASSIAMFSRLSFAQRSCDIAILDLSASIGNESQILDLCKSLAGTAILVMTDNGTIEHALRVGARTVAVDYVKKPFSKDEFLAAVHRSIRHAELVRENRALRTHDPIRIRRQS
jgi:DNA-binding NtrC family response regulator